MHRLLHQRTLNLVHRAGALDRLAHGEQLVLGTAEAIGAGWLAARFR